MTRATALAQPLVSSQSVFERLLFDLSTQFVVVKLNSEELSAAICDALGRVNRWLRVAGSGMGRMRLEPGASTILFSAPQPTPVLGAVLNDDAATKVVLAGNDLLLTRECEGVVGRQLVECQLDGVLILPLSAEEGQIIYLACWWRDKLEPSDTVRDQLRMLGELMLAALHRHDAETRQAELQERLRQGQKLQSMGLLAGGVAHDFNNILTVIRGCAEMGLRDNCATDTTREYLAEIIAASDQASAMARKLLTFGQQGVTLGNRVAVNDVVRSLQRLLVRLLRGNIELELELTEEDCFVAASVTDVEQIIMNLCINSGDAMPDGGRLKIRTRRLLRSGLSDTRLRPYVEISVLDVGHGMTKQQAAAIFDPFFTTKSFGEGAGLGLSVVHGIATQLKGFTEVESELGVGTEMRIYLPSTETPAQTTPISQRVLAAGANETILVVDDLPGVCLVVASTLKGAGYQPLTASSAKDALTLYAKNRGQIALAIVDVIMPNMGGRELCDELAFQAPNLPILFVSGYTADTLPASYLDRPDRALLGKPFTGDELLAAVARLLQSVRASSLPPRG